MFLFDTNVYRSIAQMVKSNRIIGSNFIIGEMKKREAIKSCVSIMSETTSQELLAHFIKTDKERTVFEECYNALRFQFFHTQVFQPPKRIPNIDSILNYFFFSKDDIHPSLITSELVFNTIKKIFNQRIDLDLLQPEITALNKDFRVYKKEFYMLFETLLNDEENRNMDWSYFKGNKELNNFIKNKDYVEFLGSYLIKRSKYLSTKKSAIEINEEIRNSFYIYFKEALEEFKYLFELLRDNGNSLKVLERNEKWNSVMDFHLVFEWCFIKYFNRNNGVEIILVTQEYRTNFKELHKREDVWFLEEYFEFLEFEVEGTDKNNTILHL